MRQQSIYGPKHKKPYNKELQELESWATSKQNRAIIQRWHNHLFATGTGENRVVKLSGQLRKMCLILNKDLEQADKHDVEQLVAFINREESWSPATKADYRRCLCQFYNWFEEEDPRLEEADLESRRMYKYLKKHVKTSYAIEKIDFSQVITEKDCLQIVQKGCKDSRERAFVQVLHEGGFRAAEYLNIQLQDIELENDRARISVDGKTGRRRVPIMWSFAALLSWLNDHPYKDNPQAYLWVSVNLRRDLRHLPLKHGGATRLINRIIERSGLHKKHNLHWFRHSRATINAEWMTEVMLCKFFGWVPGSRIVRTYVHAHNQQVEDSVCRMRGLPVKNAQEKLSVVCGSCGLIHDKTALYCSRCGRAMSVEVANKEQEYLGLAFDLLTKIMSDPEQRARFEDFKRRGERTHSDNTIDKQ